jgi:hypothetical protein
MVKNNRATGLWVLFALAGSVCLPSCSGPVAHLSDAPPAPAAKVAYLVGSADAAIKEYSVQTSTNALPSSTLTYPPNYYGGPVATDSSGQLYVAVLLSPVNPANPGSIFIYPPNSTGEATPSRIIDLKTYDPCALAVDANGLLYVAINPGSSGPQTVVVYPADASGNANPFRTLAVTGLAQILDIAVDAEGNVYVAGYSGNGDNAIAVYSPDASGSAAVPTRTITFPNSNVYGVAVDGAGDIFASVCRNCQDASIDVEEFAPDASGASSPVHTINLPLGSAVSFGNGGPVRFDSFGNVFTSAQVFSANQQFPDIVVFGFAPTATGNAAPIAQITPADGYDTFFAVY